MKTFRICFIFILLTYFAACKKDKDTEPETPVDPREAVVGTYFCTYIGHQVQGDSGWDFSGSETIVVTSIASPGTLSITSMVGGTTTLQDDKTFFNTRSKGHFRNDSIRLYTYTTPAAMSWTLYTGKKN